MITLFVTHIRPIVDYCYMLWNVGYTGDGRKIDGMQGLSYGERLKSLNPTKGKKFMACQATKNENPSLFRISEAMLLL